jgi:hypothetical protein
MAHHCIKYRLNPDGTVPSFLCLHENGVGGVYGVPSPGTTQHDDTVYIGISEDDNVSNAEIIATKEELETYLIEVSDGWMDMDVNNIGFFIPFDPAAAATWVWERLEALNDIK